MKKIEWFISNLTEYDVLNALENDSVSARKSLEELDKEDLTLYKKFELKQLKYWKLTLERIKR